MLNRVKNQPILALVRYGVLFLQFASYYFAKNTLKLDTIIWVLLIFIINQQRLYWSRHTRISFILNIVVEFGMLIYHHPSNSMLLILSWLPLLFDISLSELNRKVSLPLLLVLMTGLIVHLPLNMINVLYVIGVILVLLLLFFLEKLLGIDDQLQKELIDLRHIIKEEIEPAEQLKMEMRNRENLAILRERNRISRDIHDSVGHSLTTVIIQLSAIGKIAPVQPQQAAEMANTLADFTRDSLEQIRHALRELKPEAYSAYELVFLLDDICRNNEENSGIHTHFRYSGEITKVSEQVADSTLAIVREFFTNSRRHAKADNIQLHLHFSRKDLIMNLIDDGEGAPEGHHEGIGLKSMYERSRELGGSFSKQTAPGEGFKVKVVIPLSSEEKL